MADYVIETINTGLNPTYFAYNPSNKDLYVNAASSTILVINSTSDVVKSILVGESPRELIYNPANDDMYVPNHDSDTVSVIDSSTNTVIKTIPVVEDPWWIIYNPSNKYMYVANREGGTITVLSPLDIISKPDFDDTLKPTSSKNIR